MDPVSRVQPVQVTPTVVGMSRDSAVELVRGQLKSWLAERGANMDACDGLSISVTPDEDQEKPFTVRLSDFFDGMLLQSHQTLAIDGVFHTVSISCRVPQALADNFPENRAKAQAIEQGKQQLLKWLEAQDIDTTNLTVSGDEAGYRRAGSRVGVYNTTIFHESEITVDGHMFFVRTNCNVPEEVIAKLPTSLSVQANQIRAVEIAKEAFKRWLLERNVNPDIINIRHREGQTSRGVNEKPLEVTTRDKGTHIYAEGTFGVNGFTFHVPMDCNLPTDVIATFPESKNKAAAGELAKAKWLTELQQRGIALPSDAITVESVSDDHVRKNKYQEVVYASKASSTFSICTLITVADKTYEVSLKGKTTRENIDLILASGQSNVRNNAVNRLVQILRSRGLEVDPKDIIVRVLEKVTWPNSLLGLNMGNVGGLMDPVPGYLAVLEHNGKDYRLHAAGDGLEFFLVS